MKNNYIEKILSNGIKVYFYKDKNCKRTFVSYNVGYGSNGFFDKFYYDNKPYSLNPAVAHFLEHYLIEHSIHGNMVHRFYDKNYEFNGLTYPEVTSYYFLGIEDIEESIKELIDLVDAPVFTEENVELVKNAIIEELKNNQDNKYRIAFANNRNNTNISYDEVPIANNILGSVESTKGITYDDVIVAYNAYYNDENKFLVIAGNIDIDKMINLLEDIFFKYKPHPNKMKEFDYVDDFGIKKRREVIELRGDADFIVVNYKEKNDFKVNNIKQDLCLYIYQKLKKIALAEKIDELTKENVILGGIGFNSDFFKDRISITYYTESYNTDAFEEFLDKNMNLEDLNQNDFELIKKELIVSELRKKDYIYTCFKNFPTQIDFSKNIDEVDLISSLTLEDVKEIISNYKFNLKTVTIIKNKSESETECL